MPQPAVMAGNHGHAHGMMPCVSLDRLVDGIKLGRLSLIWIDSAFKEL